MASRANHVAAVAPAAVENTARRPRSDAAGSGASARYYFDVLDFNNCNPCSTSPSGTSVPTSDTVKWSRRCRASMDAGRGGYRTDATSEPNQLMRHHPDEIAVHTT